MMWIICMHLLCIANGQDWLANLNTVKIFTADDLQNPEYEFQLADFKYFSKVSSFVEYLTDLIIF